MSEAPSVVVASSGMLTGGASVVYAKHFASDERNAILLTGYQDEEAPVGGRPSSRGAIISCERMIGLVKGELGR